MCCMAGNTLYTMVRQSPCIPEEFLSSSILISLFSLENYFIRCKVQIILTFINFINIIMRMSRCILISMKLKSQNDLQITFMCAIHSEWKYINMVARSASTPNHRVNVDYVDLRTLRLICLAYQHQPSATNQQYSPLGTNQPNEQVLNRTGTNVHFQNFGNWLTSHWSLSLITLMGTDWHTM
jgi:hypothetical protein